MREPRGRFWVFLGRSMSRQVGLVHPATGPLLVPSYLPQHTLSIHPYVCKHPSMHASEQTSQHTSMYARTGTQHSPFIMLTTPSQPPTPPSSAPPTGPHHHLLPRVPCPRHPLSQHPTITTTLSISLPASPRPPPLTPPPLLQAGPHHHLSPRVPRPRHPLPQGAVLRSPRRSPGS